jgi:N-formylglutamate amidohydrolase
MRLVAVTILLLTLAHARGAEPDRLITFKAGGLPIILSAPHGGRSPIPDVVPRNGDGVDQFLTARDENTAELTEQVAAELEKRLKSRPYVVIARFERKYADANRDEKSAFESEKAKPYYKAYHAVLAEFTRDVQRKWKRGMLLDIHGQAGRPDTLVRGTNNGQTVELLVKRHGPAALNGPKSLFGVFAGAGYKVFPPLGSDEPEDRRYNGGYTVRTYGSHGGSGIDAIQLEFGSDLRQKSKLPNIAAVIAEAIDRFCHEFLPDAIQ